MRLTLIMVNFVSTAWNNVIIRCLSTCINAYAYLVPFFITLISIQTQVM